MSDLERCVDFLQRLIRTPSLPGREGDLARLVVDEMTALGYDQAEIDEMGNVVGTVRGAGTAPPVVFNTHLDHVDVGDPARWPHPPYGGEIHDGRVWGRGAVDIKGPLAAQVYGAARLLEDRPPGDVLVTAVVQEEVGGVGARTLARRLEPAVMVVGEPSSNQVRRGHRGRTEIGVHWVGRSVHASVPERGLNPLTSLGRFLARLDEVERVDHPELGRSSVAPTLLRTDQTSANVVPGEAWLVCDWRNVPGESPDRARAAIERLARATAEPGVAVEATIPSVPLTTWTGRTMETSAAHPAYLLPADHPAVRAAAALVGEAVGERAEPGTWRFATDGSHFYQAGFTPVGFGPGDEGLAHTVDEHVEIAALEAALAVNSRLGRELAVRSASR
ncbi:MAG TPA: M20/M25/M40 family metallo-hydrolase [Thermoanaerobaculia bacterium]|nr:M20/M25/M40 family metallo-hydrolase [Thermoanaerobaculia bacterium]